MVRLADALASQRPGWLLLIPGGGAPGDLHAAFADPAVDAILTVIGGFNASQLLTGIDYSLVAAHPKVLCGFSDVTVWSNALYAGAGLVGYSSPHYSSFGMSTSSGTPRPGSAPA